MHAAGVIDGVGLGVPPVGEGVGELENEGVGVGDPPEALGDGVGVAVPHGAHPGTSDPDDNGRKL